MHCYTPEELAAFRFRHCGQDVRLDRSVRIFGSEHISIGDHVRIDCFCMLSASAEGLTIGNHVHLGVGCYIFGAGGAVTFEDFSGLSARVSLFTSTDDFTEGYLTNPTVPNQYRRVTSGPIHLHQHVIIGSGAVILPNVTLEYGSAVGALTLVQKSVSRGTIVSGNPARVIPLSRNVNRLQELQHQCLQDPSA